MGILPASAGRPARRFDPPEVPRRFSPRLWSPPRVSVQNADLFLPVGTGVSSARVEAAVVRTGAGSGADAVLVVPAPQNEVQPRSYMDESAARTPCLLQHPSATVW